MHRGVIVMLMPALLAGAAHCQINQEMIDQVAAGELKEAKASWWGFDAEDATECLQAAINSGVPKLIVEDMGTPWIVRPLTLVSNQEIVFEEGVVLLAKRGEYKGGNDTVLTLRAVENVILRGYGATVRMWKEDYANPELYTKAEWRHCLQLRGATNIEVYGLTLASSGGDGIYLGTGPQGETNRNVIIKDVVCDDNYRQGISVITAENLLIENTIMRNTGGTAPMAGIDFEPNHPEERLKNVVMRNCLTENNNSTGYFFYLRPLNAESEPVSVRIENCRSVGDAGSGARVITHETRAGGVQGTIEFVNCVFEGSRNAGISVSKPAERGLVRFENCQVLDCATEMPGVAPIMLESRLGADTAVGGVDFDRVLVRDPIDRAPMAYNDQGGGIPLRDITGTLILEKDGEQTTVELTEDVLKEWMPVIALKDIPRLGLDVQPLAPLPSPAPVAADQARWPVVRRAGTYLLYALAGDEVSFTVSHQQVGRYAGEEMSVIVTAPSGAEALRTTAPFQEVTPVSFTAPETGIYRLVLDPGANRFQIGAASNPMALLLADGPINLIHSAGDFCFYVPPGTTEFGVRVAGQGPGEAIKATLLNPRGEVFGEVDNQYQTYQFEVELEQPSEGEVWTLRLDRPSDSTWEDHYVDLRGVPPLLSAAGTTLLVPGR
ncbi:MAG: right-handed parallel beta-helix repeat-containing protein [Armatimonadota bacterium]